MRWPVVGFVGCVPAPAIECIVQCHAGFKLFQVIGVHSRQAQRRRKQTGSLGREIEPGRVRSPNHRRQTLERRGLESEFLDHHVKRAQFAAMTPEHVLNVEWNSSEARSDGFNFRSRYEKKHRRWIDEAADQPRAGDPVDLGARAGYPDRPALQISIREL